MTVGETLTEARYRAGLSVDELSERTRIRGTVIRSIEEDNYEACGGDLYVRGYVRAIAGAVGIDALPLIREFDMGRAGGRSQQAAGSTGVVPGTPPSAAMTAFDLPAVTGVPSADELAADISEAPQEVGEAPRDMESTRFDLPVVSADPTVTAYDLPRVPEVPLTAEFPAAVPEFPALLPMPAAAVPAAAPRPPESIETRYDLAPLPEDLMAAGYDLGPAEQDEADPATKVIPADGLDPDLPPPAAVPPASLPGGTAQAGRAPRKRRGLLIAAAAVVVIAAGAVGISLASAGSTGTKNAAATTVPQAASAAASASAARASASAAASVSAAAQASESAAAKNRQAQAARAAQRVTTLPVVSAEAYGPDGFADGDNPGNAKYAIARVASQPWATQWYATPRFGLLKHGTGLLLDLGKKVTVTSIRLSLAQYAGSDVQIRVGNGTALQDLRLAATANNASGTVKLTLRHPAAGRYLLIWFTQLPPDGSGHYQASVSHVVVTGRR